MALCRSRGRSRGGWGWLTSGRGRRSEGGISKDRSKWRHPALWVPHMRRQGRILLLLRTCSRSLRRRHLRERTTRHRIREAPRPKWNLASHPIGTSKRNYARKHKSADIQVGRLHHVGWEIWER